MIAGHLTFTWMLFDWLRGLRKPPQWLSLGLLLIGAYLPDILDKTFNQLFSLPGRGIFHSLLTWLLIVVTVETLVQTSRFKPVWRSLYMGGFLHLAEDLVRWDVLFWPLLGDLGTEPKKDIWQNLVDFYTSGKPLFWLELISFGYILARLVAALRRAAPWRMIRDRLSLSAERTQE